MVSVISYCLFQVLTITDLSLNLNEEHEIKWTMSDTHSKGTGHKANYSALAVEFLVVLIFSLVVCLDFP